MYLDEADVAGIGSVTFHDVSLLIPYDRNTRGSPSAVSAAVTLTVEPYVLRCREPFAATDVAAIPLDMLVDARVTAPGRVDVVGLDGLVSYSILCQVPSKARTLHKVLAMRIPGYASTRANQSPPPPARHPTSPLTPVSYLSPPPCHDRKVRIEGRETAAVKMAESALRSKGLHDTIEAESLESRAHGRRRAYRGARSFITTPVRQQQQHSYPTTAMAAEELGPIYADGVALAGLRAKTTQRLLEAERAADWMAKVYLPS